MKNKTLMKIIASALAVCVAAGTVTTTAWAAEDSLSGSSGYAGTPEPGEKPSSGVTPGSRVLSDGFSDEEYTDGLYDENQDGIDVSEVTAKTKYTVGSGHIYYAPAGEEGGSAFLRLENVPVVKGNPFSIYYGLQAPLTVEAVGSNTIKLITGETAVTLTGNGSFDNSIFSIFSSDEINKENFTGELNAIVSRYDEAERRCDYTVFGNFVFLGINRMEIGFQDDFTDILTISEGASLTIPENLTLRIYGNSGDDYNSFLNIEGSLINNGGIIFFGAEPEDPSAFVESFGFSGTGMVTVTSAADSGGTNEQNSKVYDNNGFLDMTNVNGETNKMVEIGTDTPKSFYRVGREGRLYYTPPAGGSKAMLKACGITNYGFGIDCASEELPVTLCLEGDNHFNVGWGSDITLDGTGSFTGDIQTTGEFSIAESFGGGLNARIAQQIIEASGNDVSVTVNTIIYGDYFQENDAINIAGYENASDGETTYRIQAALTVPEGSSYMIPDGQRAEFNNIGNDYENYLKIDGKIINNGTIVCPGEVPDDRTAFIRSLNLSGSGFVEIHHENGDGSIDADTYTNDGLKTAYKDGLLDFEINTGNNNIWGDHMDEYGYCFEEKDGCYVLTLKDFTTPSRVVIPGDKPVIINSTGVCVIGELCISEEDTSEVTLTFGGDGFLTVNKRIRISEKSVITIDENAKITVNNGFNTHTDGKGRLIVNGALTAMCDETDRHSNAVYADALEIGSAGILNVAGSRGVWIVRASDTEPSDDSLEVKEGGQLIADCSGHGFVIDNRCNGHSEDEVISIPAGYFPHGYGFIEASEQYEYPCTPLVLALEGSQITVDVNSRFLTGSKGAEGYIAIHSHSADYDKYIPDPDHAGRHIKYCSNGSGHSDSAEACTFGDWVQTVAPTETSTGVKTRTCSVCGGTEEETIPKLPPVPTAVPAPTPTEIPMQTQEPLPTGVPTPTGIPGQTQKPVPTAVPTPDLNPTPTPVQTQEPIPTGVPTPTGIPGQTQKPLPTAVPTPDLNPTPTPVQTQEPIPTGVPTPTGIPEQTQKPLPTGVPTPTGIPEQTQEPIPTGVPAPTGIPGQTQEPLPTGIPAPTPTPVQTQNPFPTAVPALTPTGIPGQTGQSAEPTKQPQEIVTPEEVKEISAQLDSGISVKWKGNALTLKWTKTAGAEGYDIFAARSGKKPDKKSPIMTVKNGKTSVSLTKIDGKKISGKKAYSVQIKAWKYVDGRKIYTGESRTYHIAGKDHKKYTNVKRLKPEKKKYTLKEGKNVRIRVTAVKESKKKKLLPNSYGPALQYRSDHETIATVTRNGKVKAKTKGTCYIYATALNGVSTRIKITVK